MLIVGGGLAGLSAALFLAWRGVPTVLVEKHPGSSPHPRAIGFTTRRWSCSAPSGIGARIPEVPLGHGRPRRVAVESLAGNWSAEAEWSPTPRGGDSNGPAASDRRATRPARGRRSRRTDWSLSFARKRSRSWCRRPIEHGAPVVRTGCRRRHGVAARARRPQYTLRADYVIAADGHASPIREALGIGRSGHGVMQVVRSVLFRAALDEYLESGISQFELDQPGLKGMLTTYRDGRWLLMFSDDQERDEATLRAKVVEAIGRSDRSVELITTGRWVLSALIADRFSAGRVFLVGDAAHTLPPARGGYGANTGIEDAFNLAWKLASVVRGVSSPALLDTYDAERRPIAWLRHDQIFARRDYAAWATEEEKERRDHR